MAGLLLLVLAAVEGKTVGVTYSEGGT